MDFCLHSWCCTDDDNNLDTVTRWLVLSQLIGIRYTRSKRRVDAIRALRRSMNCLLQELLVPPRFSNIWQRELYRNLRGSAYVVDTSLSSHCQQFLEFLYAIWQTQEEARRKKEKHSDQMGEFSEARNIECTNGTALWYRYHGWN